MLLWESVGWVEGFEQQGQDAILAKFSVEYPLFSLVTLASSGHIQNYLGCHSTPYDWNTDGMQAFSRRAV